MQFSMLLSTIVPLLAAVTSAAPAVEMRQTSNAVFVVYPSHDCSGTGTKITTFGAGSKGDFSTTQYSVHTNSLQSGQHITFYTGSAQSGAVKRIDTSNVGACIGIDALSYGVYNN